MDLLDADLATGTVNIADRIASHAGVAALEGRVDDAVAGYRDAMNHHASVGADFPRSRAGLDLVRLVGGSHPAGAEAAAEARAIFERIDARAYLDLLDVAAVGKGIEARPIADRDTAEALRKGG
jgi:hypothetical protein